MHNSGSAPLFVCLWPLYSSGDMTSRIIASIVPLISIGRLAAAGVGKPTRTETAAQQQSTVTKVVNDQRVATVDGNDELANAISRSGDRREALGGPMLYTIVLFLCTLLGFRESPASVIAVSQMAVGDGLADIVGRRWGKVKWPFSASKSYVGSAAFVIGAFTMSSALLSYLNIMGCVEFDVNVKWPQLLLISVLCAIIELIPVGTYMYSLFTYIV